MPSMRMPCVTYRGQVTSTGLCKLRRIPHFSALHIRLASLLLYSLPPTRRLKWIKLEHWDARKRYEFISCICMTTDLVSF